jgi:LuxR family maltose regulon positive regulatory protein
LLELGAEQLQFDAKEAAQFYRSRLGRDLPAPDLQTLLTKTEGWPAALELAALVLAGSSEPKAFIQHFAGTDTSVVDYLCDMVLSQMDERTRDIVFRISMFDRICAPLARAVTDANDAEEALLGLRTRNLFLIPLDRSWEWVRFHHLVGEFFRETYRRTAPAQARECLVRGARWLHANGHVEEAVNYMIRAQEWEQATHWVADSVEELVFRRGYHQTILRWMNALPEACVDRYPVIRIQYAFALSFYPGIRNTKRRSTACSSCCRISRRKPITTPAGSTSCVARSNCRSPCRLACAMTECGRRIGGSVARTLARGVANAQGRDGQRPEFWTQDAGPHRWRDWR